MPYLVIQTEQKTPVRRKLEGVMEIGRGIGPEIWIDDKAASRTHCKLYPAGDGWMIEDLSSTNGTFINGERITKQLLRDGEIIHIGATKIVFHLEDLKEDRPSRPPQPTDLSDSQRVDLGATLTPHLDRPLPKVSVSSGEKTTEQSPKKSIAFQRPPATPIVPPKPVEEVEEKRSWWRRLRKG